LDLVAVDEPLRLGRELGDLPGAEAVAIGGSLGAGVKDDLSDVDFYIFTRDDVPLQSRRELIQRRATPEPRLLAHGFFGGGDVWHDRLTGGLVDAMYWRQSWITDIFDKRLVRFEPSNGYSTSFIYTVAASRMCSDPSGWFASLKSRTETYPQPLAEAIIAENWPLLGSTPFSYRHQIELAHLRRDGVSVNHRVAALLASYFDIVFAYNRVWHPGEKRQVTAAKTLCTKLPDRMENDISRVLEDTALSAASLLANVDKLIGRLGEAYELAEPTWR
jgi:hypothetical protein